MCCGLDCEASKETFNKESVGGEIMENLKIGDKVILVAPSGKTRTVTATDVIRDCFSREVIAIEFQGVDGSVSLPVKFFKAFKVG